MVPKIFSLFIEGAVLGFNFQAAYVPNNKKDRDQANCSSFYFVSLSDLSSTSSYLDIMEMKDFIGNKMLG